MTNLFDYMPPEKPPVGNLPPYSVSELSQALKRTVENAFGLVRVRGEVAQPKYANTGHLYFSLKDDTSLLEAVAWRSTMGKVQLAVEHGMDVICTGRLTTYAGRSKYQLVVESIELAGEGALLKLLEDRKRRLTAEGLFEASRKRAIPHIPESIGVITSPSGAVIHDILHRLADRFPRRVMVWPVAVQGPGAAEQIAAAIQGFNRMAVEGDMPRPSVLIVARGGGSLEDLMPFNEEIVVRAVAASHIPIISAVGHETDTTLIDFASDLRAPTPTAAAEFAVPVRAELVMRVTQLAQRLTQAMLQGTQGRRGTAAMLTRGLGDPRRLLEACLQRLDDRTERLCQTSTAYVRAQMLHLGRSAAALKHPRAQLDAARHRLALLEQRLHRATSETLQQGRLALAKRDVPHPGRVVSAGQQLLVHSAQRLDRCALAARDHAAYRLKTLVPRVSPVPVVRQIAQRRQTVEGYARHLESLSYKRVLERGFVVVRGSDGHAVSMAESVRPLQSLTLEFSDGVVDASAKAG